MALCPKMISTMPDRHTLEKFAAVLFALAIWQICAMLLGQRLVLVTPVTVVERLFVLCTQADFLSAMGFSFFRIVSGFLLALASGCVLAGISARFRLVEIMLWPFISTIKSVPVASFIILCLIWIGSKNLSIFISFLMVLPIVYTNMLEGIKNTDIKLLEMAAVFRVGRLKKLKYIHLPQLKPYLISACSISIGLAWKAGIAAEVIGISDGSIGEKLYEAKVYFDSGDLFAWTAVIVALSITFEKLFLLLIRRMYKRLL